MRKLLLVTAAVALLAGCAGPQYKAAQQAKARNLVTTWATECQAMGYPEGTPDFARCLVSQRDTYRASRPGSNPVGAYAAFMYGQQVMQNANRPIAPAPHNCQTFTSTNGAGDRVTCY